MFAKTPQVVSNHSRTKNEKLVAEIELRPHGQINVLLDKFSEDNYPTGFSKALTPDLDPGEAIVTQITQVGSAGQARFILLANYDDKNCLCCSL